MEVFRLADLHSILQEKVITKMDAKSYVRLKKTCRSMNEFIRSSRNISVHLDGFYTLVTKEAPWKFVVDGQRYVDMEALYGVRVRSLHFYREQYDEFCESLKKHRITCAEPNIHGSWTTEQCLALLKLLKPVEIDLDSQQSNCYEALFHTNKLEHVFVILDWDCIAAAAPKLLSTFPEVDIHAISAIPSDQFGMLRTVLQILLSKPLPNLRKIFFVVWTDGSLPSGDQLEEQLRVFNVTVGTVEEYQISASVPLPRRFPDGSSCKLLIKEVDDEIISLEITFEKGTAAVD